MNAPEFVSPLFALGAKPFAWNSIDWGQVFFWTGAISIAAALIVLMRTRWGNGRIVTKCIILSIYAHILIALYVYTSDAFNKPFLPPGNGNATRPFKVAVAPEDQDDLPLPDEPEPWETAESAPIEKLLPELPQEKPVEAEDPPETAAAEPPSEPQNNESPPPEPSLAEANLNDSPSPPISPQTPMPNAPIDDLPPVNETAGAREGEELKPIDASPATTIATGRPRETARPAPAANSATPESYRLRTAANRMAIVQENGGDEDTEAAVQAALKWLADNQTGDGRWDARRHDLRSDQREGETMGTIDTGITALAVLAFLANGETHLEGDHRETVQKGLEFLLRMQAEDGNLAGHAGLPARTYCHGMAALALCEAFAMTGDQRLKPAVERATRYTLRAQHSGGGWRYTPASQGDMSQFGWQIMALKSAELGGVPFPVENRRRSEMFIRSVSSGRFGGLASYQAQHRPSRVMTAESRVCQSLLQLKTDERAGQEAAQFILEECPGEGDRNVYYWYYGTLALFHQHGSGEPRHSREWEEWNGRLKTELCRTQRFDGRFAGSWDPDRTWGTYGGRVFQTSLSCLCLEVYYRYLPMYDESRAWHAAQRERDRPR